MRRVLEPQRVGVCRATRLALVPAPVRHATQALVRQLPCELRDRRVVASKRWPSAARHSLLVHGVRARRGGVAREGEGAQFDSDPQERGSDCKFGCRSIALHLSKNTPLIISLPRLRLSRPFGTPVPIHPHKSPLVPARVAWRPSPEQGRAVICVGGSAPVFQLGVYKAKG
jgi:hypothetical protein